MVGSVGGGTDFLAGAIVFADVASGLAIGIGCAGGIDADAGAVIEGFVARSIGVVGTFA